MNVNVGDVFSTDADGRRWFRALYRADLLPYKKGVGYAHAKNDNGAVMIIERVDPVADAPYIPEAGRHIGMYGGSSYLQL